MEVLWASVPSVSLAEKQGLHRGPAESTKGSGLLKNILSAKTLLPALLLKTGCRHAGTTQEQMGHMIFTKRLGKVKDTKHLRNLKNPQSTL